jgi:hypothetical protein
MKEKLYMKFSSLRIVPITPVWIQIAAAETNARGTVWFFCCARLVDFGLRTVVKGRRDTRFSALEMNGGVCWTVVFVVIVLVENVVIVVTNRESCIFLCIVNVIKAVLRKHSPIAEGITGAHLVCCRQFARCNSGRMILQTTSSV